MVLSVGRLVPYKGFTHLVEAAAWLPEGWKVVIGGEGPLRGELEEQIRARGLQGKVVLEGYLPQEQLPSYFAACDAFVLSSVMKTEAFWIVQIEAMSLGKPVVATTVEGSGMAWVNAHGESGLNVPPGDARALAAALMDVVAGRERYGKAARERFRELFTTERMIEKIKRIYEAQME
jgi:rhamnosyl/mannosyltransferase